MKRWIIVIIGLICAVAPAQTVAPESPDNYRAIWERNMFLRNRPRPQPPTSRPATLPAAPESIEQRFVLRGVAIEEDEFRAYFENPQGGITRVQPGDAIAGGHVAQIAIDAVAYEAGGQLMWIEVGQNLTGIRASPARTTPGATTGATDISSNGAPKDPATLSVEERMKQRTRERNRRPEGQP